MDTKKCDCNKNFGNKELQGSHDINCESRKEQDENEKTLAILEKGWLEPSSETQEQALKDAITAVLDQEGTNQVEFLIEIRDTILDYIGELK